MWVCIFAILVPKRREIRGISFQNIDFCIELSLRNNLTANKFLK